MMKRKNGFTLIELLAIIVILAIIAVITVPLILGIIDNAKEKAVIDSAYGYKDAVNKLYTMKLLNNKDYKMEDRVYTISELNTEGLSVSGKEPESNSWIQIENNNVKSGCLQYDEYKVDITNGEVGSAQKSECVISFNPTSLIVTSGDGLYESTTDEGRLIYRGANPNNYINIKEDGTNNTLYRIVSFEADGTIKVVRDESIGNIAWDKSNVRKSDGTNNTYCTSSMGCNVWGNQTNTLYNGSTLGDNFHYVYYESADSTTLTNEESGKVGSDSTLNQYLNSKTNNTTNSWQPAIVLDNYIDNHSWNVGGVYYTAADKGIIKEKEEEKQLQWNGKVGLLNITEFVEASTNSGCTSVGSASNNGYPCKESNWTFKGITEWSLSPFVGSRNGVWYVSSSGSFGNSYRAYSTYGVRPAFYLKSEISLTGEGTPEEPYSISNM